MRGSLWSPWKLSDHHLLGLFATLGVLPLTQGQDTATVEGASWYQVSMSVPQRVAEAGHAALWLHTLLKEGAPWQQDGP